LRETGEGAETARLIRLGLKELAKMSALASDGPPRRLVSSERRGEDGADTKLRPQILDEFVGQAQARANLSIFIEAARGVAKRSTMCCSSARPASARRRWRRSWRASSA